ncbi:MAG: hypothetical protein LC118_05340 [Dehalococcoidia bacterium]|nr:hypothetical protein [Dehalococcoidia bacterium]
MVSAPQPPRPPPSALTFDERLDGLLAAYREERRAAPGLFATMASSDHQRWNETARILNAVHSDSAGSSTTGSLGHPGRTPSHPCRAAARHHRAVRSHWQHRTRLLAVHERLARKDGFALAFDLPEPTEDALDQMLDLLLRERYRA